MTGKVGNRRYVTNEDEGNRFFMMGTRERRELATLAFIWSRRGSSSRRQL